MVSFVELQSGQTPLAVVGLGYVGLPLALALAKKFAVIGFDIDTQRVSELRRGHDRTCEVDIAELATSSLEFSSDPTTLRRARFIIVAVPTPVTKDNRPDLTLVERASEMVGKNLASGSVVVFESTVYPGVTEELCLPLLARASGLTAGQGFKVGYSPERINPGDREHSLSRVTKVVAGMDSESLELMARVYGAVAPIFRASSIKVAEAAKVIENTQRDINIALMNELAVIFKRLGLDTSEVLAAAGTKWNFLTFVPGLVGGHCIGVDPYYLTYKARTVGYESKVILAGRALNDSMGAWIARELERELERLGKTPREARVLVAGITFKENVPDVRNSKVFDIVQALRESGIEPFVSDPLADPGEVKAEYGLTLCDWATLQNIDLVILAVAHRAFQVVPLASWKKIMTGSNPLLADIKNVFGKRAVEAAGLHYWGL